MPQSSLFQTLHSLATATGNGAVAELAGFGGDRVVEITESNNGTATVVLEGSFDNANWLSLGYELTSATASPARAVADISVTGNTRKVYQLLDSYPYFRARISAVSSPKVTVKLYALPA